jgi:chemotaxis response regulator CheB
MRGRSGGRGKGELAYLLHAFRSVDVLLKSFAKSTDKTTVGINLTGMQWDRIQAQRIMNPAGDCSFVGERGISLRGCMPLQQVKSAVLNPREK